jgi:hypothetical protein
MPALPGDLPHGVAVWPVAAEAEGFVVGQFDGAAGPEVGQGGFQALVVDGEGLLAAGLRGAVVEITSW